MTESEELQAILSEPGKAVGKYFDLAGGDVAYIHADMRTLPMALDYVDHRTFYGARGGGKSWVGERWHESGQYKDEIGLSLTRVRKADPNRNLNLKVGMKVRLVNGGVVTLSDSHGAASPFRGSNGELYMEDGIWRGYTTSRYAATHICEVISEPDVKPGMLEDVNERLRKVEREIVDIKSDLRRL